ncbi:hypothetical protein FRB90_002062, partial [Tulasnella sp. 427]
MHELWTIPELAQQIIKLLGDRDRRSVAQVCRTLWLQALPLVWEDISFKDIVRLSPDHATKASAESHTQLLGSDQASRDVGWERALLHTLHTARTTVVLGGCSLPLVHELLSNLPPPPLFPALRAAFFVLYPGAWLPIPESLDVFLTPTVSEVFIDAHLGCGDFGKAILVEIVNRKAQGLQLSSFRFTNSFGDEPEVISLISDVLRAHRGIQTLDLKFGQDVDFRRLIESAAQLPDLQHLCLTTPNNSIGGLGAHNIAQELLLQVETLDITGHATMVKAILALVGPAKVKRISVKMRGYVAPSANHLGSLNRFINLRELQIISDWEVPWPEVRPALECKKLESLLVSCERRWTDGDRTLPETELEVMSEAWPHLQEMLLGEITFDLEKLGAIASRFRNLKKLSVNLRMTADAALDYAQSQKKIIPNESLEELVVLSSAVWLEPKLIAATLRTWWPRLAEVKENNSRSDVWSE